MVLEPVEPPRLLGQPFVVTSTGDASGANTGDTVCDDGTEACTLRAAIEQANAMPGLNMIYFNIPGAGPHTIQPTSALPDLTEMVLIDGTKQPGYDGLPLIELDGSQAERYVTIRAGSVTRLE